MTAINYSLLSGLRFNQVSLWDYLSYFKKPETVEYYFPVVKLKDVISLRKKSITIDDNLEYKRCRVQLYSKGIELRDEVKGTEIKTKKQQVCQPNDFLVAEIDAKSGGYGIVPQSLKGAIVSSHYFLYEINETKLLPSFLELYVKTDTFFQQVRAVGSTNYAAIRPHHVLDYVIILPTLATQTQLVAQYNQKLNQAQDAENQANDLEKDIENYLLQELGIEKPKAAERKLGLQKVRLTELSRWDLWNNSENKLDSKFKLHKLEELVSISSGSFLPNKNQIEGNYLVYGGNGITGKHNEYSSEGKKIVIGRVGEKCGNVHLINGKYWITDNAFKVDLNSDDTTYEYLELVLKFIDLNRFKKTSAQPSLSQSSILNLEIPLPNIKEQRAFVEKYNSQKEQIKSLRQQAETLRKQAKADFEKEIFV